MTYSKRLRKEVIQLILTKKQLAKMLFAFLLVCGISTMMIVSLDISHIEWCEEEGCIVCSAIHFSQEIVMLVVVVAMITAILFLLIYFYLEIFHITVFKNFFELTHSLVKQKIQLND